MCVFRINLDTTIQKAQYRRRRRLEDDESEATLTPVFCELRCLDREAYGDRGSAVVCLPGGYRVKYRNATDAMARMADFRLQRPSRSSPLSGRPGGLPEVVEGGAGDAVDYCKRRRSPDIGLPPSHQTTRE